MFKKGLVVGIIALFIGAGIIQPVLSNEVSISTTSDNVEDCIECQSVDRIDLLRFRILSLRIEIVKKIILSKIVDKPEIKNVYKKLLGDINFKTVLNKPIIYENIKIIGKEINSNQPFPPYFFICVWSACSLYYLVHTLNYLVNVISLLDNWGFEKLAENLTIFVWDYFTGLIEETESRLDYYDCDWVYL